MCIEGLALVRIGAVRGTYPTHVDTRVHAKQDAQSCGNRVSTAVVGTCPPAVLVGAAEDGDYRVRLLQVAVVLFAKDAQCAQAEQKKHSHDGGLVQASPIGNSHLETRNTTSKSTRNFCHVLLSMRHASSGNAERVVLVH